MRAHRNRIKRKRRARRADEEQALEAVKPAPAKQPAAQKLGPHYAAGPMAGLTPQKEEESGAGPLAKAKTAPGVVEAETEVAPLPIVQGRGMTERVQVHNTPGGSIRLAGRTDANYDGGSYRTEDVTVSRGSGCVGCAARECIHVTGTLVAAYSVATTVTLPSADDYPNLTACQRRRVQHAIDTVLAPHEQQHVQAFNQYNGTTRRVFDLTLCRGEFNSAIHAMFQAEEQARRSAAQAASDALDPFHFEVDLNCQDEETSAGDEQAAGVPGSETEPEEE